MKNELSVRELMKSTFYYKKEIKIMYGIKISYSWGDCEDELYGNFKTEEEAFEEMCMMAAKEAYVQNEEFLETHTCEVLFNAFEKSIDLHYYNDDTWCYYRVVSK